MTTEQQSQGKERIGVYVCHCGTNISGTVDVEDVSRWASENLKNQGVVISRDYKFMCSSLGQELIQKDIQEMGLTLLASLRPERSSRSPTAVAPQTIGCASTGLTAAKRICPAPRSRPPWCVDEPA